MTDDLPTEWALERACDFLDLPWPDEGVIWAHWIAEFPPADYQRVVALARFADTIREEIAPDLDVEAVDAAALDVLQRRAGLTE